MKWIVVFALLLACESAPSPAPTPPKPSVAATAKQRDDCRDACEQTKILLGGTDEQLRACRARCDGENPPPPPHEVPRSISKAPALSRPPAVRPR